MREEPAGVFDNRCRVWNMGAAVCSARGRLSPFFVSNNSATNPHKAPTEPNTYLSFSPVGNPSAVGSTLALNSRHNSITLRHSSMGLIGTPSCVDDSEFEFKYEKAAVATPWTRFKQCCGIEIGWKSPPDFFVVVVASEFFAKLARQYPPLETSETWTFGFLPNVDAASNNDTRSESRVDDVYCLD